MADFSSAGQLRASGLLAGRVGKKGVARPRDVLHGSGGARACELEKQIDLEFWRKRVGAKRGTLDGERNFRREHARKVPYI